MKAIVCLVLFTFLAVASAAHTNYCGLNPSSGVGNLYAEESLFGSTVTLCFTAGDGTFTGQVANVGTVSGTFDGLTFTGQINLGGITYGQSTVNNKVHTTYTANTAAFVINYYPGACVPGTPLSGTLGTDAWQWTAVDININQLNPDCPVQFDSSYSIASHYYVENEDGDAIAWADFCLSDSQFPSQVVGSFETQHGHRAYIEGQMDSAENVIYANIWRFDDKSGNIVKNSQLSVGAITFSLQSDDEVSGVMRATDDTNPQYSQFTFIRALVTPTNGNAYYPAGKDCTRNSDLSKSDFVGNPSTYDYKYNTATLTKKDYRNWGLNEV